MKVIGWIFVFFGVVGTPGNLSQAISGERLKYDSTGQRLEREPNAALTRGTAVGGLAACAASVAIGLWLVNGGTENQ
jgi:hypothetical protein